MNLSFITWNVDPTIFEIFGREVRYYGLSWALAFIISGYVMERLFRKDGISKKAVESLTMYIIIGTIVGARLGHCFFYNQGWHYFKNPIEILYIHEGGLASHGAGIGIAIALFLYNRKYKLGYLWTLDRLVIAVAISGCLIRFGNLMNSEIIGKPTDAGYGFVFPYEFKSTTNYVSDGQMSVKKMKQTNNSQEFAGLNLPEYEVTLEFEPGIDPEDKKQLLGTFISNNIVKEFPTVKHMIFAADSAQISNIDYNVTSVKLNFLGIPRHAAQLYESISCLILFLVLMWFFYNTNIRLDKGKLVGYFLIVLFTLRFLYEYLKEVQEEFEASMALNMGQILSIIPILIGIYLAFFYKSKDTSIPVWVDPKPKEK